MAMETEREQILRILAQRVLQELGKKRPNLNMIDMFLYETRDLTQTAHEAVQKELLNLRAALLEQHS
jgi:hypothetical protein